MYPGFTTRAAEQTISLTSTIQPLNDIVRVNSTTSTTVLTKILPPFNGFGGVLFIINESGNNITTLTTGNIKTAVTIGVNVAVLFVYSQVADKWYPGALA